MNRTTTIAHRASVALMGLGVLVATLDGFTQSYAGLYHWATEKGLKGWKADSFPALIDLFVAIGELGLFALALEGHRLTRKGLSWADIALPFGLASAGWGVSLAFNVGSVDGDWTKQVTAAVAPVASMLGLLVMLRTVHRLIVRAEHDQMPAAVDTLDTVTAEPVPDGYAQWDEIAPDPQTWARWPLPELPAGDGQDDDATDEQADDEPPVPEIADVAAVPADVLARARQEFAEHLQRGKVPGIRPIRRTLGCGQPRAQEVRAYLAVLAEK